MFKCIQIPFLIVMLFFSCVGFSSTSKNASTFIKALTHYTQLAMRKDKTPGVVVLVSSPKLGTQSLALGASVLLPKMRPMSIDNNFRVASISKTFLAVMILKMVEEGKLNLYSNIKRYLPSNLDLSKIPNLDKILLIDLLQMTSGIPEYYDVDVDEYLAVYPYRQWRPRDALHFSSDLNARFKPGNGYQYSNTNYILLQLILREVTGKNLTYNLEELIAKPLGLKHTFADDFKMSAFTLNTKGYDTNRKEIDVSLEDDGLGVGDTFVITTAKELQTFLQSLFLSKTLLKPKTLAKMLKPNEFGRYGMGVEINELKHWGTIYSHNGLVTGFQTNYFYLEQEKLTIIILTNNRSTRLIEPIFIKTLELYSSYLN